MLGLRLGSGSMYTGKPQKQVLGLGLGSGNTFMCIPVNRRSKRSGVVQCQLCLLGLGLGLGLVWVEYCQLCYMAI